MAVIGGGPGGLYAARLLKRARPSCQVVVYEQSRPGDTFGFGVGLAARTRERLAEADEETLREIELGTRQHAMQMRVRGEVSKVASRAQIGIARPRLLDVLHRHAAEAGVDVRFGQRMAASEIDADLIIAADGVSSATRINEPAFGGSVRLGAGLYLWAATDFALETSLFEPVETEHGVFVTHAYPYQSDRSTFLIETDPATLKRARLDRHAEGDESGSDSDSLRYLESAFTEALHGHRLIGNRTRWSRFRTVRAQKWHHGNVVLLGDAAHTAHYSVGSGTKMAMEDAIELVRALTDFNRLDEALRRYEAVRRPAVERIQDLAHRSQLWWESFPQRLDLPIAQLMNCYMSRAGNVPPARFARSNPDVMSTALSDYAGRRISVAELQSVDLNTWVLEQPLDDGLLTTRASGRILPQGDPEAHKELTIVEQCVEGPWSSEADDLLEDLSKNRPQGFLLVGPADRPAVLDRLDFGERLRKRTGGLVALSLPEALEDDAVAGLISGRIDLVQFDRPASSPRHTNVEAFAPGSANANASVANAAAAAI
ncbi:FAD-dependent monooxygenase [Gordonia lacunae]|uniref:FAD-dependent monooxygenase n=1 Tax=Gordonia lacunae TaxID=417102 RepID=UPI0026BB8725